MRLHSLATRFVAFGSVVILAVACGDGATTAPGAVVAAVSVTPAARDLTPGQTIQLTATPLDAAGRPVMGSAIAWATKNPTVATVTSAGLVEAHAVGTATITATAAGRTGEAVVTVATSFAPVASVSVSPESVTLTPGSERALLADVRDAENNPLDGRVVSWSSGAPDVASVSATGVVTALKVGTAVITATSEGKEGFASITVEQASTVGPVARIDLSHAAAALSEGDQLDLVATPRDAEGRQVTGLAVQWTSSDPTIAHVGALGRVTAIRAGDATITARVHGRTAQATLTVTADYAYDLMYHAFVPDVGYRLFQLDIRTPGAPAARLVAGDGSAYDIAVSPDGTRIAYSLTVNGSHSTLYVAERDGGNAVPLTSGPGLHDQPTWSPDGTRLAYRRWHFSGGEGADIWVIELAPGAEPVNLTGGQGYGSEHDPAWSPEGRSGSRIAYARHVGTTMSIWTVRPDGGDPVRLTSESADAEPSWSPDGQHIVFQRIGDIAIVNASGGSVRTLVGLPFGQFGPAYSPDGRLIAFTSRDAEGIYQVFTVWPDGSKLAQRTWGSTEHAGPAWIRR